MRLAKRNCTGGTAVEFLAKTREINLTLQSCAGVGVETKIGAGLATGLGKQSRHRATYDVAGNVRNTGIHVGREVRQPDSGEKQGDRPALSLEPEVGAEPGIATGTEGYKPSLYFIGVAILPNFDSWL